MICEPIPRVFKFSSTLEKRIIEGLTYTDITQVEQFTNRLVNCIYSCHGKTIILTNDSMESQELIRLVSEKVATKNIARKFYAMWKPEHKKTEIGKISQNRRYRVRSYPEPVLVSSLQIETSGQINEDVAVSHFLLHQRFPLNIHHMLHVSKSGMKRLHLQPTRLILDGFDCPLPNKGCYVKSMVRRTKYTNGTKITRPDLVMIDQQLGARISVKQQERVLERTEQYFDLEQTDSPSSKTFLLWEEKPDMESKEIEVGLLRIMCLSPTKMYDDKELMLIRKNLNIQGTKILTLYKLLINHVKVGNNPFNKWIW